MKLNFLQNIHPVLFLRLSARCIGRADSDFFPVFFGTTCVFAIRRPRNVRKRVSIRCAQRIEPCVRAGCRGIADRSVQRSVRRTPVCLSAGVFSRRHPSHKLGASCAGLSRGRNRRAGRRGRRSRAFRRPRPTGEKPRTCIPALAKGVFLCEASRRPRPLRSNPR